MQRKAPELFSLSYLTPDGVTARVGKAIFHWRAISKDDTSIGANHDLL
jgi:hypothetical protein